MSSFQILRLVTQGDLVYYSDEKREKQCHVLLMETCRRIKGKVSLIQAAGGFLFEGAQIEGIKRWPHTEPSEYASITSYVEEILDQHFFDKALRTALKKKADFFTFGVDVFEATNDKCPFCAELVGTYDTQKEKIIYWTGKSYPTQAEQNNLISCPNLETHCQLLNGFRVLVLGCHDLNIFSPRSRASIAAGTSKANVISQMQQLCDKFKPQVVIQHPHTTDTPNIWNAGWSGVRSFLPEVKTYSSGIHYYNHGEKPRKPLSSVLSRTATPDVRNIVFSCSEDGSIRYVR